MPTLLIEIEPGAKAKQLSSILASMDFVKKISAIKKPKAMIAALQEHEEAKAAMVAKKNKAMAKYL
jgi:hypothetical protein